MPDMKNLIITKKGHEFMARMIAGTTVINFTKICTSNYDYSKTALEELIELEQIKQTTLVSKVSRTNNATVQIEGALTNSKLTEGYLIRSVGIYAKDEEGIEIIYAVSVSDNPDYMPPFNGSTVSGAMFKLITTVSNSSQVSLEVNPAAVATIADLKNITNIIEAHTTTSVQSEKGIHGIRVFNDKLEYFNGTDWIDAETGGTNGIAPKDVSNISVKVGNGKLTIKWADPEDTVVDGEVLCKWKGTKLVQKVGCFPRNIKDGTIILDNQVKNAYKTNGFEINGLTNDTVYYFQLFPYSDKNTINGNATNRFSGEPKLYKIMTAKINLSNSNPKTCVTYADNAVGMTPGSSEWDEFFGHYPCLFKNGKEVGKLNTENFAKFADGSAADITSGSAGDVMIAFPRRGVKITTVGDILTVTMTDNPDDDNFEYLAHRRGSTRKEKFYLGAYKGYKDSSDKLRSLSGKTPTVSQTIGTFRTQAQANGIGYEQSGFYQLTFRQVMYILKYRNLDSQTAVGRGYVDGDKEKIATGGTNTKGMDFGETTGKQPMKLFGLEDFWGNVYEWVDGIVTTSTRNMLTATTGFNNTGSGYTDQGQGATANIGGCMNKPQGSTKTGFLAKEASGSETTYFCDYANLSASCVAYFGGICYYASYAGAFQLRVYYAASNSSDIIAARLMYL